MRSVIVFLAILLWGTQAHASVWLMIFAQDRVTRGHDINKCVNSSTDEDEAGFADQGSCEGAGHVWYEESKAGRLDRGDIFHIKPGGFSEWGTKECGNNPPASGGLFACVEISDKDEAHARNYLKRLKAGVVDIQEARFYVDVDALPAAIKNTLWNTGELSRTWAQVKPYILDKETGAPVP